jgi:hypothetical protein
MFTLILSYIGLDFKGVYDERISALQRSVAHDPGFYSKLVYCRGVKEFTKMYVRGCMLYRRLFSRYYLADRLHDAGERISSSIMAGGSYLGLFSVERQTCLEMSEKSLLVFLVNEHTSRQVWPFWENDVRDRLIAWASQQPEWATGFLDEVWWSRFALP